MTRALAQDALRYASRDYADETAHRRKMEKLHGEKAWNIAAIEAHIVWVKNRDTECTAVLQDMVERAISRK